MLEFITDRQDILSELLDEVKLFFPYPEECDIVAAHCCESKMTESGYVLTNTVTVDGRNYKYETEIRKGLGERDFKRLFKRACKIAVYRAFSDHTGIKPPWGSLTGIRPSKLVYDMLNEGVPFENCAEELTRRFEVGREKSRLICDIVKNQRGVYIDDRRLFNLYIHIPFCTSKCRYCSFATELVSRSGDVIDKYVEALKTEIDDALEVIGKYGELHTVYVGGGTPTALDAQNLYKLLSVLSGLDKEFTVEAGRPDTITAEKLDAIKQVGATRICVNPQTLNDKTLELIGRSHTSAEFFDKYELAKSYGFDVNVDLIAGLNGENLDDFVRSVDGIRALDPENITVHTLSRKNGSELKQQGQYFNSDIIKMTEYAQNTLTKSGYIPYYLYRQKSMLENLENVGYCKPGKQCKNNVTTMEDCMSVIACGAGAITKAVGGSEKRIARFAGIRDVRLYLDRFDEKIEEKRKFCQKQFTNPQ